MLLHTGEKPYTCEPCNRRFGQPSEYKLHMLRHTGVKNFACTLCPLRQAFNHSLLISVSLNNNYFDYLLGFIRMQTYRNIWAFTLTPGRTLASYARSDSKQDLIWRFTTGLTRARGLFRVTIVR